MHVAVDVSDRANNTHKHELQALVYGLFLPTTVIIGYAIVLRKLASTWRFFADI